MQSFFYAFILSLALISGSAQAVDVAAVDEKTLIHDANIALADKDYQTAFSKYSILAERGKAMAQFNLGVFYLNGQGVQKDDKQAYEWLQKSAAQGNARALQLIESAAARGNVDAKDALNKAREQAARAPEVATVDEKTLIHDANIALADKDYQTAFSKYSILAERGKAAAQFNLGVFYLNGQGVQKDDKQAYEWLQKSAAKGNARALQLIESAVARGNADAKDALNKVREQSATSTAVAPVATPAVTSTATPVVAPVVTPVVVPVVVPVPQVVSQTGGKIAGETSAYVPFAPKQGQWVFGASADYMNNRVSEALPYSVNGATYTTTQSYSYTQPGISAWLGYDNLSVITSYSSGRSTVNANVQGAGSISKSFQAKEIAIDVRWLLRGLSSSRFTPYVLFGYEQKSNDGTASELQFQDTYSQMDRILDIGAGAIIPVNETIGFQVDARVGSDKQKHSHSYTPSPGVLLSFYSYNYTNTATFSRLTGSMYYNIYDGWNAQLGASYESYPDGVGSSVKNAGIFATLGYAYRRF